MSPKDWFRELDEAREARTRRDRHGQGELTLLDGVPQRATGCLLPDGSKTDARCLLPYVSVPTEQHRVWTRRLPGSTLCRRGRLIVDSDKALFFIDEPAADLAAAQLPQEAMQLCLERDLGMSVRIRALVGGDLFATLLYGALCNTVWRHKATGAAWHCCWRGAGGAVAHLRGQGDYLDWYCSGGEGSVDEQVLAEINALGWELDEREPAVP